jgi:hypothetical protein
MTQKPTFRAEGGAQQSRPEGRTPLWVLSLLKKTLHHRGIQQNSWLALVIVGFRPAVSRARVLVYEVFRVDISGVHEGKTPNFSKGPIFIKRCLGSC